jgi:hypothetical protein
LGDIQLLDKLFGSRVRAAILKTIFSDLQTDYYSRLLEKVTGMDHKAIWKELNLLEKERVISSYRDKRYKRYRLNRFPGWEELGDFVLIASGQKRVKNPRQTRRVEPGGPDSDIEQLTLI